MMGFISPVVVLVVIVTCFYDITAQGTDPKYPAGDVRNCFPNGVKGDVNRFEVLPGSGWDNLRNVQAGMIVALNYSLCRTTDDGRFIIPDFVNVYPVKTSRVDSFAEIINDYTDYVSSTNKDINVDAGFKGIFDISGTFDDDYIQVKTRQLEDDTFTTRVQARYVRYRAVLQPDMPLLPAFKYRLMSIAGALELNSPRQARFQAQQLVREFGTHVSTGLDAGAALIQEDQISVELKNHTYYSDKSVKIAAGVSFMSHIGSLFAGAQTTTVDAKSFTEKYMDNRTDSLIKSIGGPVVNKTNTTIEDWVKEMSNDMVAIGRSGEPIFNFINAQTVPELPGSTLLQLVNMVREAVSTYYKVNTHPGCTDRDAQNFSPRSNVNDGSCKPALHNTTFGGVYQVCNCSQTDAGDLCTELTQHNPATGDNSCPNGYEAVPLHSGHKSSQQVDHVCGHCFLIFGHCCHDEVKTSSASYESFWCAPLAGPEERTGYLFGGVYTSHISNAVTSTMTCPHGFVALKLGEDIRVCVSDEFEEAEEYSVPFGGFFSCSSGNPLAIGSVMTSMTASHMYTEGPEQWPRRCPQGYSQYLTEIMPGDGCEINHCAKASALAHLKLPKIKRPPFVHAPVGTPFTDNVFVFDPAQNLWLKNDKAIAANKSRLPVHTRRPASYNPWPRNSDREVDEVEVVVVNEVPVRKEDKTSDAQSSGYDNSVVVFACTLMLFVTGIAFILLAVLVRRRRKGGPNVTRDNTKGLQNMSLFQVMVDEKRKV